MSVTFENGDQYLGDWANGKKNGKGRMTYSSNQLLLS